MVRRIVNDSPVPKILLVLLLLAAAGICLVRLDGYLAQRFLRLTTPASLTNFDDP